jgi:hypothetical protein
MIVSLPGSFSSKTRTAKTMVASPRGPNQPMNSLSAVGRPCPDQAEKDRKHTDDGQAEHGIEQRRPGGPVDQARDHDATEHHPGHQRQRLAHVLGTAQKFFFVTLTQPAQQQPLREPEVAPDDAEIGIGGICEQNHGERQFRQ